MQVAAKTQKTKALCKLAAASIVAHAFGKHLWKRNIWLISEKWGEARDNGYIFYRYLKENHPEIDARYVIARDGIDVAKVEEPVYERSFLHYLLTVVAKYNISSQKMGAYPGNLAYRFVKHLIRKDQKNIFLQHGITKDYRKEFLFADPVYKCDLFVAGARPEYEYFRTVFGYPKENTAFLGFCRFDKWFREKESRKQILVMPTWRQWLKAGNVRCAATEEEMAAFKKSDWFCAYYRLLTDRTLLDSLKKNGYRIVFFPHSSMQSYLSAFQPCENDYVMIADQSRCDIREYLATSGILLTDYSSTAFDFAYMEKPVLYYQYDAEQFRARQYQQGYFDYEAHGFGPVAKDHAYVVECLNRLMQKPEIPQEYTGRVRDFFPVTDEKNCERTYDAIMALEEQTDAV